MKKIIFIALIVPAILFACKKSSKDTTPPVIKLKGDSIVYSQKDSTYVDAGATATDDVDGDISSKIVVSNPVDIHHENTFYISFNVADNAGNNAVTVKRKVIVTIF